MTVAAIAPAARLPLALSEHRNLRFFVLFLLYVAQGLPFGLFLAAMPAWLAQGGASAGQIGTVLAMVMLPWTLKLFYCFLVDRYAFLVMGRRRPWIIVSQLGIVVGLIAMAIVNPAAQQASLVAAFAFAINIASSMQDVAVDGLAVDLLPGNEIARGSGFFYGGQALGVSLAGGIGGYLIAFHGLPIALIALAAITAVILVAITIVCERPGERLLPWTKGFAAQRNLDLHVGAFVPIIRDVLAAMFERRALFFVGALFFGGAVGGLILGVGPIYSVDVLGWQKNDYSSWASQSNLVAAILAIFLLGSIVERWGARRSFILANTGMAAIAFAMLMLQPIWTNGLVLIGFIFASRSMNTFRLTSGGAFSMGLCTPAVAASQFTVLVAFINFGNMTAGASLGWIDSLGGIPAMFTALAVCGLLSAAFAFAAKAGR